MAYSPGTLLGTKAPPFYLSRRKLKIFRFHNSICCFPSAELNWNFIAEKLINDSRSINRKIYALSANRSLHLEHLKFVNNKWLSALRN